MLAVVAGAVALTGCGSSDQPRTEAFEPPAVTSSPSPSAPSEAEAILAAYREFFARQSEISAAPKEERRELLEPFTTGPELQRVLGGMFAAEEYGEVGYGQAIVHPTVRRVDGDNAVVTDCQDTSMAGRKKRDSGTITTKGTKDAKVRATLVRGADGQWRVSTVDYPDATC
jgi:hypothetical protein